jgi:hypothetical protein
MGAVNDTQMHAAQLQKQQPAWHSNIINTSRGQSHLQQQQQQHMPAIALRQQLRKQLPHHVLQLLLALLLLLLLPSPSAAQQPMPFQGQGDAAPSVPTEVHVSMFLDRLLGVDDREYEFKV